MLGDGFKLPLLDFYQCEQELHFNNIKKKNPTLLHERPQQGSTVTYGACSSHISLYTYFYIVCTVSMYMLSMLSVYVRVHTPHTHTHTHTQTHTHQSLHKEKGSRWHWVLSGISVSVCPVLSLCVCVCVHVSMCPWSIHIPFSGVTQTQINQTRTAGLMTDRIVLQHMCPTILKTTHTHTHTHWSLQYNISRRQ